MSRYRARRAARSPWIQAAVITIIHVVALEVGVIFGIALSAAQLSPGEAFIVAAAVLGALIALAVAWPTIRRRLKR